MEWRATIPLVDGFGALSVNRLYITRKQDGRRALSKDGKAFQRSTINTLIQGWGLLGSPDQDKEYRLVLHFYFPAVFSKGWPKKAESRFRRIDHSNFVKFFQDCVATASGVDDANHTVLLTTKREDPINPRVEILLEEWEWLDHS